MSKKITVVHGRFQPIHLGHLNDYIIPSIKHSNCDLLLVGITNSDPYHTKDAIEDKSRSADKNNPFTYFERMEMLRNTLLETGMKRESFEIVPFPINVPEILPLYCPHDATYYITIFDDWGRKKERDLITTYGKENVVEIFERPESDKHISATLVRQTIIENGDWERLVPNAVTKYLKENDLIKRIKKAA